MRAADIPNQSELPAYPTCVPNNESSWDHKLILHSTRESGLKKYNTCVKCLILQDFSCFERRHTVENSVKNLAKTILPFLHQ